jgi:hypothetical protein
MPAEEKKTDDTLTKLADTAVDAKQHEGDNET